MLNLAVATVAKGWRTRLKLSFVMKISSFQFSESKNLWFLGSFCMKSAEMYSSKQASTLDVAMVTNERQKRMKVNFCFEN